MLTSFDDYPIHQTGQPIAHTESGDPNHYDRYFFNGYTSSGSVYFALAMGLYPNRAVHDAAFSVVRGGEQVSVFASGRAPADRMAATRVGPIEVVIVEPMRVLRLMIDAPDQGLRAELTFRARTAALEEPRFLLRSGSRLIFDFTRLTQMGTWEGWVEVDGERIEVSPAEVSGSRDRSWGVRPCGERVVNPPSLDEPQYYWLWAPLNFPGFATHFDVNEYADGRRWHQVAAILPASEPGAAVQTAPRLIDAAGYRVRWRTGTRHMAGFELDLHGADGESRITLEPILHFPMIGIGYGHPEWNHGSWRGESAVGGARLALPVTEPANRAYNHVQTLSRATYTGPSGEQQIGTGILETMIIGNHGPTGLTGVFDGFDGT